MKIFRSAIKASPETGRPKRFWKTPIQPPIGIEQCAFPLLIRLPFLIVASGFFLLGIYACLHVIWALIDAMIGVALPKGFLFGVAISVVFTGLGAMAMWVFFIPAKVVIFNTSQKTAELTQRYPFGIKLYRVYKFCDIQAPEVSWHRDAEYMDGGFWELILTLPDGRSIPCVPNALNLSEQKEQAEQWRDSIIELLNA